MFALVHEQLKFERSGAFPDVGFALSASQVGVGGVITSQLLLHVPPFHHSFEGSFGSHDSTTALPLY